MKTNVTYIDACEFETILIASGLAHEAQKGFVRVDGPTGRRVYVASTKRVGRVDISGFEMRDAEGAHLPGYVAPHCGPFGNVKQQLDFSLDKDTILKNFAALLEHMKGLQPVEKKTPAKKDGEKKAKPAGWQKVDTSKEARAKSIAAKAEAKKKNAPKTSSLAEELAAGQIASPRA